MLAEKMKLNQLKAEQPTTTYDQFVWSTLREICRTLDVPVFFGGLDAEKTNMASAYVISQPFVKSIQVDRSEYDLHLDRILDEFLTEAIKIPGLLSALPDDLPHEWYWPNVGTHADPQKVARAEATEIAAGTNTIPHIFAQRGEDWESAQVQQAKALGLTVEAYRERLVQKIFGALKQQEEEEGVGDPAKRGGGDDGDAEEDETTQGDDDEEVGE